MGVPVWIGFSKISAAGLGATQSLISWSGWCRRLVDWRWPQVTYLIVVNCREHVANQGPIETPTVSKKTVHIVGSKFPLSSSNHWRFVAHLFLISYTAILQDLPGTRDMDMSWDLNVGGSVHFFVHFQVIQTHLLLCSRKEKHLENNQQFIQIQHWGHKKP